MSSTPLQQGMAQQLRLSPPLWIMTTSSHGEASRHRPPRNQRVIEGLESIDRYPYPPPTEAGDVREWMEQSHHRRSPIGGAHGGFVLGVALGRGFRGGNRRAAQDLGARGRVSRN